MAYLLLLIGFVLLIKGADFFVDGSSSLARILKVPSVVIGLTLVSIGTSAPEAAVSITAGIQGISDIALGNIVGSNIFNILAVIGCCALIRPVTSPNDILKRDLWCNIGVSALLLFMMTDLKISRLEGLILILAMACYIIIILINATKNVNADEDSGKKFSVPKSLIFIVIGLAAVIFGGQLVVNNATVIAKPLGMSDTLVGLTIVAIGTSLPELVTSIVAAKKGDSGIALGNAIGSCIFNILFIIGIASMLSPIHVATELIIDTVILIAVCVLITIFARTKKVTSKPEGAIMLLCYIAYTAYIIIR
ncbi:MAG: calcium/sodium antiporter [Clostridia bacterium]|nr:calcium/sodium antiporter [Clostridia bacterium]